MKSFPASLYGDLYFDIRVSVSASPITPLLPKNQLDIYTGQVAYWEFVIAALKVGQIEMSQGGPILPSGQGSGPVPC